MADEPRYTEAEWRQATAQGVRNACALSSAIGYQKAMQDLGIIPLKVPVPSPDVQALLTLLREEAERSGPGPEVFGGDESSGFDGRR